MKRPPPAPGPVRRARLRTAATLALALLATVTGSFEVHPHEEGLAADLGHHAAQGDTLLLGASHPGAAPHVEPPGREVTFRCPVCLLHLQSAGEAPARALAARPPSPSTLRAPSGVVLPSPAALQPGGSRAPPAR